MLKDPVGVSKLAVVAAAVAALAGCGEVSGDHAPTAASPVAPSAPSAPSVPPSVEAATPLSVPDVTGQDGAVALGLLRQVGFVNVQPTPGDGQGQVVPNPAGWTVTTTAPGAGARVASSSPVVVTMTRK